MALGATRGTVVRSIVRDSLIIVGAGVVMGVPSAILLGRIARSQLYGIAPNDPYTIAIAILIFMAIGAAATRLPAKRAASLDPVQAIKQD
jgi:ABC-type antimicrobial peptide transport system permease subunit